jgi:hypothetical protein
MFKKSKMVTVKKVSKSFQGEGDTNFFIRKGDRISGQGWKNDEPKIEWAEIVIETIKKKTILLNKPHFNTNYKTELLIYDNTPIPIFGKSLDFLQNTIKRKQSEINYPLQYESISIIINNNILLYDITNTAIRLE